MKNKRDTTYDQAIMLYKNKNYQEAQKNFKTVVSIDPEYKKAKVYLKRTTAYLARFERQQKIQEQKKLRALRQRYYTGLAYKKKRRYESALTVFLSIQDEDPYFEEVEDQIDECREKLAWKYSQIIDKAQDLKEKKEYKKAYATALTAKKYDPDGREAASLIKDIEKELNDEAAPYKSKADVYYNQKKFQLAKDTLKKAETINPWDTEINEKISQCNKMIRIDTMYNDAMKYYRKKDYYTAYAKMLSVNRQEQNYKNSEKHIEHLKLLLNKNINIYYNRGLKYYEQNKFQAAINEWNKVLMIDSGHDKARYYRERAVAKLETQKSLKQ